MCQCTALSIPHSISKLANCLISKLFTASKRETIYILQCNTGTFRHTQQRIFGYMERNIDFVCQTLVQTTQQSTTTSQINTVQNNISIKFRRSLFQCTKDSCFNFCNTLFQTMRHLLITHWNFHGKSSDTIRPRTM